MPVLFNLLLFKQIETRDYFVTIQNALKMRYFSLPVCIYIYNALLASSFSFLFLSAAEKSTGFFYTTSPFFSLSHGRKSSKTGFCLSICLLFKFLSEKLTYIYNVISASSF